MANVLEHRSMESDDNAAGCEIQHQESPASLIIMKYIHVHDRIEALYNLE